MEGQRIVDDQMYAGLCSPSTVEEFGECVTQFASLNVGEVWDLDPSHFRGEQPTARVDWMRWRGVIEISCSDLVVTIRAGTKLSELQNSLGEVGLWLPLSMATDPLESSELGADPECSVADAAALNLPHGLEASFGSWKDWILGASVLQADGVIAKSGSKVVKSVAGYDLHKMLVGSRHCLFLPLTLTLRATSLKAKRPPRVLKTHDFRMPAKSEPFWIQRVLPSDFEHALKNFEGQPCAWDEESSTIWALISADSHPKRYPGDWALSSNCASGPADGEDPCLKKLMLRAKEIFDPEMKLNPGVFGYL